MNIQLGIGNISRTHTYNALIIGMMMLANLLLCPSAFAFTAETIGDYGDITVMAVEGNYDGALGNGETNSGPREIIARELYKTKPDEFDFIVIFSNFDFQMPASDVVAFYLDVRNDVRGIGKSIFDCSSFFGSGGVLQGTIDMGNLDKWATDPMDEDFSFLMGTMSHELMHRWAAYIQVRRPDGSITHDLLGKDQSHWSFLLDTQGSLMYGNPWQVNGDGTFTSLKGRKYYSPLDLYLMGIVDKSDVPSMLLIDSPETDAASVSKPGVTISGTTRYVTVDDIIAAEGERIPGPNTSQKDFKVGCVFITRPNTFTGKELDTIRTIMDNWVIWHSSLTNGKSKVVYRDSSFGALPHNTGPDAPAHTPRVTPPEIGEGIAWLIGQQQENGSWQDTHLTIARDTTCAVSALSGSEGTDQAVADGSEWLDLLESPNFDYLARKVVTLLENGAEVEDLVQELMQRQLDDGGWGAAVGYTSNPVDTAIVLEALCASGDTETEPLVNAVNYLRSTQNDDGGWGSNRVVSDIKATAKVLTALHPLRSRLDLNQPVSDGIRWLKRQQHGDGGFGEDAGTVYDTAIALIAFKKYDVEITAYAPALEYLFEWQSLNGSWRSSVYETALAVQALKLWEEKILPDLQVAAADIRFSPESLTQRPQDVAIEVTVSNHGFKSVDNVSLSIYDGVAIPENIMAQRQISVPARSSVTTTFSTSFDDALDHFIFAVVDSGYQVDESNENNNSAYAILMNDLNLDPDLQVRIEDMIFDPATIRRIPEQVELSVRVRNTGATAVPQANVVCYRDAMTAANLIGRQQIAVGAQSSTAAVFNFTVSDPDLHRYFIVVDPEEVIAERSEYNNQAIKLHEPEATHDFSFGNPSIALTASAVTKDQPVGIAVQVTNTGTRDAFNVPVRLYIDDDGTVFEIATLNTDIAFSGSATLQTEWISSHIGTNFRVYAQIDPQNRFDEVSETNNLAYELLSVTERPEPNLTLTHNDIMVTPSPAGEGGNATIVARIQNNGSGAAGSVELAFAWNQAGSASQPLGRVTIPALAGGEVAEVSFSLSNINVFGDWFVSVTADPDNQIVEVSEDDNEAFKSLTILSLPELGISSGAIGFAPKAPAEGDVVTVSVLVQNSGGQNALNVPVVLYDGAVQVDSGTLATVPGNSQAEIQLSYDTAGRPGVHSMRCIIDPDNTILEKRKDNNTAVRTLGVQNGDLWLSQRYISADGGIDHRSTTFFFRLDESTTVTVVIVNSRGRIVRTFSGPELENTTGATVTWDGLNDRGMVVADGDYQVQVRDLNGNTLRSLPTTMDNNLSPLAQAIGTQYLSQSNVSCMLPDIFSKQWFSDESGLVFHIDNSDADTPEFPSGLYTMAPDGEGIQRLVPWQWSIGTDPTYNYTYGLEGGEGRGFYLSPDDNDIAFVLEKHRRVEPGSPDDAGLLETHLYIVDRFGETQTLVDSYTYRLESGGDHPRARLKSILWSADSAWLAYRVTVGDEGSNPSLREELYLARPDGSDKISLPVRPEDEIQNLAWSPEGQQLLYVLRNRETGESTLHTYDPVSQTGPCLYQIPPELKTVHWINAQKIVAVAYDAALGQDSILVLDASQPTSVVEALALDFDDSDIDLQVHPFGEGFGFIHHHYAESGDGDYGGHGGGEWSDDDGYAYVRYCDDGGQCEVVHKSKAFYDYKSITNLKWSEEGYRLAFVDWLYEEVARCQFVPHLVTMDWETKQKNAFPVSNPVSPYRCWGVGASFHIWAQSNGLWLEQAVLHYGSVFETRTAPLPQPDLGEDGTLALRIIQTGTDAAHIDAVSLVAAGQTFSPVSAAIVGSGVNILGQVRSADGIAADVTAAAVELEWNGIPEGRDLVLSMKADEFNHPADGSSDAGSTDPDDSDNQNTYPQVDFYADTLKWLYGGDYLIGQDSDGHFAIDADTGEKAYFEIEGLQPIALSPRSRYLTYEQDVPAGSICVDRGEKDLWVMQSLLNLTADLRVVRESLTASIGLKVTAADLNFDHYQIEYADLQTPDDWTIVKPPTQSMALDETICQWLPPGPGTYRVRLTAADLAGHVKTEQKRVSWGSTSPIGNLYLEDDYVSANGDGVKDTLQLHYTIFEPVHLEFYIYDSYDTLVATLYRDYLFLPADAGRDSLVWGGRARDGHIVADGSYRIEVLGLSLPFVMDRTSPEASLTLSEIKLQAKKLNTTPVSYETKIFAELTGRALDQNLSRWVLEYGRGDNPQEWFPIETGGNPVPEMSTGKIGRNTFLTIDKGALGLATGNKYRVVVEDHAGNRSTQTSGVLEEVLILSKWKNAYDRGDPWFDPGLSRSGNNAPETIAANLILPHGLLLPKRNSLKAVVTYRSPAESYTVQYRTEAGDWIDGPQPVSGKQGLAVLEWDQDPPSLPKINAVRLKARLQSGQVVYSNSLSSKLIFGLDVGEDSGIKSLVYPFEALTSLTLRAGSFVLKDYLAGEGEGIPYGESIIYSCFELMRNFPNGAALVLEGFGESGRRYFAEDSICCNCVPPQFNFERSYECDWDNASYKKRFLLHMENLSPRYLSVSVFRPDFEVPGTSPTAAEVLLSGEELAGGKKFWDVNRDETLPSCPLDLWKTDDWAMPDLHPDDYVVGEAVMDDGRFYRAIQKVGPDFEVLICCPEEAGTPVNGLIKNIPDMNYLRFEVIGGGELLYSRQWLADAGDTMPQGFFKLLEPAQAPQNWIGRVLEFNLYGQDSQGFDYSASSKSERYENCKHSAGIPRFEVELKVSHHKASVCDALSPGQVSLVTELKDTAEPVYPLAGLRYYVERSGQWYLLQHQGLTTEVWEPAVVDTYAVNEQGIYLYDEGEYRVKVIAVDTNGNVSDSGGTYERYPTIVVDRVLPDAAITAPAPPDGALICPAVSMRAGQDAPRLYVDIGGSAQDDRLLHAYQFFYAYQAEPDHWHPVHYLDDQPLSATGDSLAVDVAGQWDVTNLMDEHVLLKLEVTDGAGNVRCGVQPLQINMRPELTASIDSRLFSPNGDGLFDTVAIAYAVEKEVSLDAVVLDSADVMIKRLLTGYAYDGGQGGVTWDGTDNDGRYVPDGLYSIRLTATDRCPLTTSALIEGVEVDRTPPAAKIGYPQPDDALGTIVEVIGTAHDPHFAYYRLEILDETHPEPLQTLANQEIGVQNGYLGKWNTFGAEGRRILRLTAGDSLGNVARTTTTIDLGVRQNLIVDLGAAPLLFSPNNDGRLETVTLSYNLNSDLNQNFNVLLEIMDPAETVVRSFSLSDVTGSTGRFVWDGLGTDGLPVPDGIYQAVLTASFAANTAVVHQEKLTLVLDATAPAIALASPRDNAFVPAALTIQGDITDTNIDNYTLKLTGEEGARIVDQGQTNRRNHLFTVLNGLADGPYTVETHAVDRGQIESGATLSITVDKTEPQTALEIPQPEERFGNQKHTIAFTGRIVEENIEQWQLRYRGRYAAPDSWTILTQGDALPAGPLLHAWEVGAGAGVEDGHYVVSLYAADKAGWESACTAGISIDNTAPEAAISAPAENSYVTAPTAIEGTASDTHLLSYGVSAAPGDCAEAFQWAPINTSATGVTDGLLARWQVLPTDDRYCLRVVAEDHVGHIGEARLNVVVDTHPPAAPVLNGEIENRADVRLTWTGNSEPDLAGYNLYRNGQKLNDQLIPGTEYLDPALEEGRYAYVIRAVDQAGWESQPSDGIALDIDLTPPTTRIRVPEEGADVSGLIEIKGTAYSEDDFKEYRLYAGQGAAPANWQLVNSSPVATSYGTLGQWETAGMADGATLSLRLEAEDLSGNMGEHRMAVTIDNQPPAAPVLISADVQGASGSDIHVTWQANTEPDLAGYLLYRNGELANVTGTVIGELTPYLLGVTAYTDTELADGTYAYYLAAMDTTGNLSGPSNGLTITIDTRAPRAQIVSPADGYLFDQSFMLRALSRDLDIAAVQFQYKTVSAADWNDLNPAVDALPFVTYLNPADLGLRCDSYQLRAVATDTGGRFDDDPPAITVEYKDITPPAAPIELNAAVNGGQVTLTWTANTETDLAGYHIYRVTGEGLSQLNTSPIPDATYIPSGEGDGLADDDYAFQVFAVDAAGNQSRGSNIVSAVVYTPLLEQPFTPTARTPLELYGRARPSRTVRLFNDTGGGPQELGTFAADDQGNFFYDISLTPGINRVTVIASDDQGNTSKPSAKVVVVHGTPPAAPVGLEGAVDGHDCTLTWTPNAETDLAGYHLYRNGVKQNSDTQVANGDASASVNNYRASYVRDGSVYSYWYTTPQDNGTSWWQLELPAAVMISGVELDWYKSNKAAGKYELQAWSGYAWIPLVKVMDNRHATNRFDIVPAYVTDRIRLVIPSDGARPGHNLIRLSEVKLWQVNPVAAAAYTDQNVTDGTHDYHLEAINILGMVSPPSDSASVDIGDVTAPEAVTLSAAADAATVRLSWTPSDAPDLAGYHVYKRVGDQWLRLSEDLLTGTSYADANLANGTFTYRVTVMDLTGNESPPSNEASATVNQLPPPRPIGVTATSLPQGGTIQVCWDAVAGAAGYRIYRSTTSGGPYEPVGDALITATCYLDRGLIDGTTYYYMVHAVDALGNESADSLEDNAVPADLTAPSAPVLFAPTAAGKPISVDSAFTHIGGWAEPGAAVDLFHNGLFVGSGRAAADDMTSRLSFETNPDLDYQERAVSPDGRFLAVEHCHWDGHAQHNVNKTAIYEMTSGDLTSGDRQTIVREPIDRLVWSPDSTMVAYRLYRRDGYIIVVYDRLTRQSVSIPVGYVDYRETSPVWSADGETLIFTSNRLDGGYDIFAYRPADQSVRRLTENRGAQDPQLSADNRYLTYVTEQGLYAADLLTGDDPQLIADNLAYGFSHAWALHGSALAFVNNAELYTVSPDDWTATPVAATGDVQQFNWLPGGRHLGLLRSIDSRKSYWVAGTNGEAMRLVETGSASLSHIYHDAGGTLYLCQHDLSAIYRISPAGRFQMNDVALKSGENLFVATATDAAGNLSPESEGIIVNVSADQLPDIAISAADLLHYPRVPLDGDPVLFTAIVHNNGSVDAQDVAVAFTLWYGDNTTEIVHDAVIEHLAAGEQELVQFEWDSSGMAGKSTLVVDVDPEDHLFEASETNNMAFMDFYVADAEGLHMVTEPEYDLYGANEDVNIAVELYNTGPAREVTLTVEIMDAAQQPVAAVDLVSFRLPYTPLDSRTFVWNTGRALAGDYYVHSILSDDGGPLAENLEPFTIEAAVEVAADLVTDRLHYNPRQTVQIHGLVTNRAPNMVLTDLTTRTTIRNAAGQMVDRQDGAIDHLFADTPVSVNTTWDTGLSEAGRYTATLTVSEGVGTLAQVECSFHLDSVRNLNGALSVQPALVAAGTAVSVDYTVSMLGNTAVTGLPLTIAIVAPDTRTDLSDHQTSADIGVADTVTGTVQFDTSGYADNRYPVELRCDLDGETIVLAKARLTIRSPAQLPVSLSGTLAADPAGVTVGTPVTLLYTVTNGGQQVLDPLHLQITVPDGLSGDYERTLVLPAGATISGSFVMPTDRLVPEAYRSELLVRLTGTLGAAELANTSYTVVAPEPRVHRPVAVAGGPYLAAVGETVQVDGSASFDLDEGLSENGQAPFDTIMAYEWEIHMVEPYEFDDAAGVVAELPAFDTPGLHAIALRVTDNTETAFPGEGLANMSHSALADVEVYVSEFGDLSTRCQQTAIWLFWTHIGAETYEILRSETGPGSGFETIGTTTSTYSFYTDEETVFHKDYWYRVRCMMGDETRISEAIHVVNTGRR
jgi:subtilase family serine protease/Tol biopolymer transport system component/fibronectin type 3 domain-containing protein